MDMDLAALVNQFFHICYSSLEHKVVKIEILIIKS